ncbi:MAG: acetyl-CoA carboxylase biotin carboxyl carrier protein subunit [Bacteroidales bacterium]|nr:MAG: acetyl-CoA carboxylase biotin carboxyl carrier protein subunit [Bacteroidales bacterium]
MTHKSNLKSISNQKETLTISNDGENNNDNKLRLKTLIVDGERYRTFHNRKFAKRKNWVKPDEKSVISFIPCTIIKVFAVDGQSVTNNDAIALTEAMKMQNTIYFPMNGRVKRVYIRAGDKIPKGFVMVEYE